MSFYYVFLILRDLGPFVVASFLCAGSQSVALRFLQKCIKSWKNLFSCKWCSFLHTFDIALNMACAPNATRSRCFAAGVCRFPECTLGVLFVFNIDVHRSAIKRPLPIDPWPCRCTSEAHFLNPFLVLHLVAQFGSFCLPRVLTIHLLVSVIGVKCLSWCPSAYFKYRHILTFMC